MANETGAGIVIKLNDFSLNCLIGFLGKIAAYEQSKKKSGKEGVEL